MKPSRQTQHDACVDYDPDTGRFSAGIQRCFSTADLRELLALVGPPDHGEHARVTAQRACFATLLARRGAGD